MSDDGNTIAIGQRLNDDTASIRATCASTVSDGIVWNQLGGDIDGQSAGDASGFSVALSADGEPGRHRGARQR